MIIINTLNQYTLLGLRSRNTANLVNISKQSNATAVTTTTTATIASVTTANGSNTNTSSYNQRSFSDYFNTWIHSSGSSSSLEVLTTTLLVSQEPSSFPGLQKTITTLQKMTPRDRIILGMYCWTLFIPISLC